MRTMSLSTATTAAAALPLEAMYSYQNNVTNALQAVLREELRPPVSSTTTQDQRRILGDVLIQSNADWSQDTLALLDDVWQHEASERPVVTVAQARQEGAARVSLPQQPSKRHNASTTELILWRGDITTLAVDVIVNAANEQGLGCFQPSHRCIDNVIHRRAGPRLRAACRTAMADRGEALVAGSSPLVTPAFYLPSQWVYHVTGPQVGRHQHGQPTQEQEKQLAQAYWKVLDETTVAAAQETNITSLAFCGISTGLFGFPKKRAAHIALVTVRDWLAQKAGQHSLQTIVLDVFGRDDEQIYKEQMQAMVANNPSSSSLLSSFVDMRSQTLQLARQWIEDADAVLICAGAGMSVKEGEMVYVNQDDFARHYPWMPLRFGYHTAYECMGLLGDSRVPTTAKWAFQAQHMENQRWKFSPNGGYNALAELLSINPHDHDSVNNACNDKKDYFVLTSNVDACFERSGHFEADRIYTPQGEWTHLQCLGPCRPDAIWKARPVLDEILPQIDASVGEIPPHLVPTCPYCGGPAFGNVRGGAWFLHDAANGKQNAALREWLESQVNARRKVVVLEVGAGFNTPTVTRFLVESVVREQEDARLIRINPSDPQVPGDLAARHGALSIPEGWQVLQDLAAIPREHNSTTRMAIAQEEAVWDHQRRASLLHQADDDSSSMRHGLMRQYYSRFDWRQFLAQLMDWYQPPHSIKTKIMS